MIIKMGKQSRQGQAKSQNTGRSYIGGKLTENTRKFGHKYREQGWDLNLYGNRWNTASTLRG